MIKSRARALIKPMAHQAVSIKHDATSPVIFDCSDPGTGKTAVRIWTFAERRRKRGGRLLVLAPKSLLDATWASDFAKFAPDMKVAVAYASNRADAFDEKADVYVVNSDGVKWLAAQKKDFWLKMGFTDLVVDESTAFKHHTSQRSKAAAKVAKQFKRRACLTGTPNGNTICDVWHQVYLLDDGHRLGPSFYGFRQTVSVPEQVGRKREAVRWVDRDGSEEAVFGLISDIVVRHKFEDCVDIPANRVYEVPYELPPKARKAYDAMLRDNLLPLIGASAPQLTAVNAAAAGTKLLQIASGAVYDNDHQVQEIDGERYKMILDLADARKHSLVFFFWAHQLARLVAEAEARGMTYCVLDGNTTQAERNAAIMRYQAGHFRVMFAHPRAAAHGLTLTKGTATIWPCPTPDLELFTQGNKRQHRIGQTKKTETIVVFAKDTVEERIYFELLMAKSKRMTTLLDLFSSMTEDFKAAA